MRQTIRQGIRRTEDSSWRFLERLPPRVAQAFYSIPMADGAWDEIHLRAGRYCSVTIAGETSIVPVTLTGEEMDALLLSLCNGSMYAYRDSLIRGYLSIGEGIRVGVCGIASTDDSGMKLLGLRAVDTLCVRFSHPLRTVGHTLIEPLRSAFPQGTLVYAPPGGGKTTLLRALAAQLAGGESPLRVALVDTRCELDDGHFGESLCISVLSGYPKGQGIEIAARTLNAQLIVCDEIGSDEAEAVLSVANCGVPILASAHAADWQGLLCRPALRTLHDAAVFGLYIGMEGRTWQEGARYRLTQRSEIEEALCG